ncbi:MAG: hypothetical protein R3B57_14745 [Phycisphaerales bacterium]
MRLRLPKTARPRLALGAFGKHPAWDDHMTDFGLETERLVALRRVLYAQGVGGRVDSGAWERLGSYERLPGFDHVVLWSTPEGLLAGRLWSSVDGKGRAKYPLAMFVHVENLPTSWALARGLEAIESLHAAIDGERDAGRVVAAIEAARTSLREEIGGLGAGANEDDDEKAVLAVAGHPQAGRDAVGLMRVIYHVRREMPGLLSKRAGGTGAKGARASRHVRAPRCAATAREGAAGWLSVMQGLVEARTPVMAIAPNGAEIVDLIVGEPAAEQFYCLLAGEAALPPASEIPYEIDAGARALVESMLSRARAGGGGE